MNIHQLAQGVVPEPTIAQYIRLRDSAKELLAELEELEADRKRLNYLQRGLLKIGIWDGKFKATLPGGLRVADGQCIRAELDRAIAKFEGPDTRDRTPLWDDSTPAPLRRVDESVK
jgi:hypothetical protein